MEKVVLAVMVKEKVKMEVKGTEKTEEKQMCLDFEELKIIKKSRIGH